jgi:hypothetical protein
MSEYRVFGSIAVFLLVVAIIMAAILPAAYSVPFFGFAFASSLRSISLRKGSRPMRHASYLVIVASAIMLIITLRF